MNMVTLGNTGLKVSAISFGGIPIQRSDAANTLAVVDELEKFGINFIDTARGYTVSEEYLGAALKGRRDKFILATKSMSRSREAMEKDIGISLGNLQTDYIDLMLIHQTFGDYYGTWRAMEHAVKEGKVRAIGLSNFYPDRFVDMAEYSTIKPAVNQLVANVFSQQWDAQAEMKPYGTRLMAWGPLAQGNPELQDHPLMQRLASKYGKTPQQVALRYLIERDIIAIPKTTHFDRMKQNLDVFDFELTSEEMQSLRALDRPIDFRWSHRNPELVRFLWNYDKNFNPKNQAE